MSLYAEFDQLVLVGKRFAVDVLLVVQRL